MAVARGGAHRVGLRRIWVTLAFVAAAALAGIALVLFGWPLPPPAQAMPLPSVGTSLPPETWRPCTRRAPCLAVVIDDVGRDPRALRRLLALGLPLSYSVLPHARHTKLCVRALRAAGAEVLLHLPMEPADASALSDEPLVLGRRGELAAPLEASLAAVPGVSLINNHMGSAFTADKRAMRRLLRLLAARGIAFLDSRTSPETVGCRLAPSFGVPCLTRDVFLDDPNDPATVRYRLFRAARQARQRGWAIAIGHPLPRTLATLERELRGTGKFDGVRLVRVSRLLNPKGVSRRKTNRPPR